MANFIPTLGCFRRFREPPYAHRICYLPGGGQLMFFADSNRMALRKTGRRASVGVAKRVTDGLMTKRAHSPPPPRPPPCQVFGRRQAQMEKAVYHASCDSLGTHFFLHHFFTLYRRVLRYYRGGSYIFWRSLELKTLFENRSPVFEGQITRN